MFKTDTKFQWERCKIEFVSSQFSSFSIFNFRRCFLQIFIFILRCLELINTQQISCESVTTCTVNDIPDLTQSCRIDSSTIINSDNFTFASEVEEYIPEIFADENQEIQYLPNRIYEKFPNLLSLSIWHCALAVISKESLQKLTFMQRISFNYNNLTAINVDTFEDMTNLKWLMLDHNRIQRRCVQTSCQTYRFGSF